MSSRRASVDRHVDEVDESSADVRFAWSAGGTASMVLHWSDEAVCELAITFDR